MDTATPDAPRELSPAEEKRNRFVIGVLIVSAFIVILNETVLSVALAPIMRDLGIADTTAQWLQTGFMLTMAVVIPTTGFLLQRFSTRSVFILAMSLFSAGTLIAALSPIFPLLLLGRIVQATGTAVMMPLLMTTVMMLVPPHRRGSVMGSISIVISVAPAIGPTVSGLILQVASWRFLFVAVLPIALAALVFGALRMQSVNDPKPTRIDLLSVVLSGLGFGALVYGFGSIAAPRTGGTLNALLPFLLMGVGAISLTLFTLRQLHLQRSDSALLDLRTFRFRNFTLSMISMMIAMCAMFGVIVLLPMFLQRAQGYETVLVGLAMLPGGLLMGVLAPFVGRWYDRIGPRPLAIPGAVLLTIALSLFSQVTLVTPLWFVIGCHLIMSVGLALLFTPLFTTALGALPPPLYSHGSALVGTLQQVAAGAGTALMVMLMAAHAAALINAGVHAPTALAGGTSFALTIGSVLAALLVIPASFLRHPEFDARRFAKARAIAIARRTSGSSV